MTLLGDFCVDFIEGLYMIHLLSNVLLVLLDITLLTNTLVGHLAVKFELQQAFTLLSTFLSQFLFLIVEKGIELDNSIPLIILQFPGLSHLRENFVQILLG